IIKSLLIKQEHKIIYYVKKLKEKFGENINSLIINFPEIKFIIDIENSNNEINILSIQDVVKNFLEVFLEDSKEAFPLVIAIDEINFIDSASLLILKDLLTKNTSKNLFIIGALSENNITSSIILKDFLEDNQEQKDFTSEIKLEKLDYKYISQFISDTFNTSFEKSETLSQLLIKKTDGDFNSIKDFIKDFYNEGLIYFDIYKGVWLWDIPKISTKNISDKVAEFLLNRFNSFNDSVKRVLNIASCIGCRFSFETLSEISGILPEDLFMLLIDCLNEEVIIIREDYHEFSHEKLQKEIYDNINQRDKEIYHLMIAKNLIRDLNHLSDENKIFTIENHFYIAKNNLIDQIDIETVINIEYAASKKARELGNYLSALEYINKALYFIKEIKELNNKFILSNIILEKSELCVLLNMYDDFEELQKEFLDLDLSVENKIRLFDIKIKFYNNTGKNDKSIEIIYYMLNKLNLITYD
ncbi:MAG: ATP-binding protein, partial [Candidatus Sericytochromatia bacterium]